MGSCVKRFVCPNKAVCSTGRRAKFYYPGGGTYAGYWLCNKHHGWGIKTSKRPELNQLAGKKEPQDELVYEGNWVNGKRQGAGSLLRKRGTTLQLIYTGNWYEDQKTGMGKYYYTDGCVYIGQWLKNRRHGMGLQYYADGSLYLGEWETGFRHGLGVLFEPNGNRYEGHFARGYKNGEGVFYHMHTGQIQKGMWENGNAKVSIMQDEIRLTGDRPSPYIIPSCYLKYPNEIMRELFQRYRPMGEKAHRQFNETICTEFLHKYRQFASFEERFASPTGIDLYKDRQLACTCHYD